MKTIKIIDLLNKIANGEKVPKKIKINNIVYEYRGYMYCTEKANYQDIEDYLFGKWNFNILNEEAEILEEEKQETKPITKKDFETLGYACGEIQKAFTNGWTKSLENRPLKEEKKIPEKLNIDKEHNRLFKKDGSYWSIKAHQIYVYEVLNEIIDYLKSKGE